MHDGGAGRAAPVSMPDVDVVFDNARDLLLVMGPGTEAVKISRSWADLLGYDVNELVGTALIEQVHPEERGRAAAQVAEAAGGGRQKDQGVRVRTAAGDWVWVRARITPLQGPDGLLLMTAHEITDQRALEERLRERIRLQEMLVTVCANLVAIEAVEHDPAHLEISACLGVIGEAIGVDRLDFVRADRRAVDLTRVLWVAEGLPAESVDASALGDERRRWWGEVLEAGRVLQYVDAGDLGDDEAVLGPMLRAAGARSVAIVPIRARQQVVGFIAATSVRERRRLPAAVIETLAVAGEVMLSTLLRSEAAAALADATDELAVHNRQLEHSNEQLERFAVTAAHDLRAPLSRVEMALTGLVDTLALDPQLDAVDDLIGVARRATVRMRALIDDLLAYATVGHGLRDPEPVALSRVVDAVLGDLAPLLEQRHADVHVGELPAVVGHRTLLVQLVTNLVTNAVKFARADRQPRIEISAVGSAEGTVLRVADNGIGIDPANRAKVFAMFTRLGGSQEPGSGIGLATAARVAAVHGGRIWVDDGIDGGACVSVLVPDGGAAPQVTLA